MIALVCYQLVEFGRTRRWVALLISYLVFLLAFYVLVARDSPGRYGPGALAVLALGVGSGWTLNAGRDSALWQVMVVATGSLDRARTSRIVLSLVVLSPLVVLSAVSVAAGRLAGHHPWSGLLGVLLVYGAVAGLGTGLGLLLGRRGTVRSIGPATVLVDLVLLSILLRSAG
ncbi:MAG: hypothetical protein ACR2N4_14240 [Jatrophihabitans sp.]